MAHAKPGLLKPNLRQIHIMPTGAANHPEHFV